MKIFVLFEFMLLNVISPLQWNIFSFFFSFKLNITSWASSILKNINLLSDVQLNSYLNPEFLAITLRIDLLEILQRMVVPFEFSVIKYLLSKVINALTIYSSPNSILRDVSDICQYMISFVKLFLAYKRISFYENCKLDVLKFSIIGRSRVHNFYQLLIYQNTTYPFPPVTKYF